MGRYILFGLLLLTALPTTCLAAPSLEGDVWQASGTDIDNQVLHDYEGQNVDEITPNNSDDEYSAFFTADSDASQPGAIDEFEHQFVNTTATRKSKVYVWVILASLTSARLFHNRYYVGSVKGWKNRGVFPIRAKYGDSIEITSQGTPNHYGVVALVKVGYRKYVTGKGRHFKVTVAKNENFKTHKQWATPKFNSCKWERPVAIKPQPQYRLRKGRYARKFPFQTGAKYVWAPNDKTGSTIYIRLVIGDEICPSPSPSPPVSPAGAKRCRCVLVRNSTPGECFEYQNPKFNSIVNNRRARCKRRTCAPRYECVSRGVRTRTMCVRRFATTEIQKADKIFRGMCKTVPISRKPFYVLYTRF